MADVDLLVVGAPVLAFSLPSDQVRHDIGANPGKAPAPPDLTHLSMRDWLKNLPSGNAYFAAFETRIWWSPRGATSTIIRIMKRAGYREAMKRQRFIVTGAYGPLRDGELTRARRWGEELASEIEQIIHAG